MPLRCLGARACGRGGAGGCSSRVNACARDQVVMRPVLPDCLKTDSQLGWLLFARPLRASTCEVRGSVLVDSRCPGHRRCGRAACIQAVAGYVASLGLHAGERLALRAGRRDGGCLYCVAGAPRVRHKCSGCYWLLCQACLAPPRSLCRNPVGLVLQDAQRSWVAALNRMCPLGRLLG